MKRVLAVVALAFTAWAVILWRDAKEYRDGRWWDDP